MFRNFFFFKSCCLWDNVEKYITASRPQMTIRHMHIACWIPKATDTHSEYVILLLFRPKDGDTSAPECYILRTLPPLFDHLFIATTVVLTIQPSLCLCHVVLIIQSSLCLCHEPVRYSYICTWAGLKYRIYSHNSRTFLTKILYLNLGCVIYARKRFYVNKFGYTGNFLNIVLKAWITRWRELRE
jgi:hypothetical protein